MFKARIKLPAHLSEKDVESLSEPLSDIACGHVAVREDNDSDKPWLCEFYMGDEPDPRDLTARLLLMGELDRAGIRANDWTVEKIEDRDWLAESYKSFQPFEVGPFFIYGSHWEGKKPKAQIGLQIDAATAFGSGEHGTTKGCLEAMTYMKEQGLCPWNVLDLGTGSGILGIAAWRLWKTPVLATDIDAESIVVAKRHCEANAIPMDATGVRCMQSDGFKDAAVQAKKPYELIIANILAGTLKDLADDIKEACDENGYIILSGILNEQAQDVIDVYEKKGFTLQKRFDREEWSTLILHNAPA